MKELHIYPNRKFFVLKMDKDFDILKIPIPQNLTLAFGHLVLKNSYSTDIDSKAFCFDSDASFRDLFGDYIQNIFITDCWKYENWQIKTCSFEEMPR